MLHQLHHRIQHLLFTPRPQPWLSLLFRFLRYPYALIRDVMQGQLTLRATGLVYTTLLSIAPLMALAFSILKGLGYGQSFQPLLLQLLQPLGDTKAQELTSNMMSTINNIRSGVLGSLGLVLLIYTVITTIQKVEESFNFVWRVEQPRSMARRFGEYLSVTIVGPVLIAAAIGVFTALTRSDALNITHFGAISWLANKLKHLAPFILVSIAFSFVYGFIPNTKVRMKSALIAGFTAGAIWTVVGMLFTKFVASSTQTAIIYAGFAIVIVTLIWIYTSWLVLLVGAQLSFYVQHPTSLRVGYRDVHMTPALQERIGLTVMYLIAYNFRHDTRQWTLSRLSRYLDFPIAVLRPVLNALLHAKLVVITEEEGYIPARDLAEIQLHQVIDAIRNDVHETRTPHLRTIPAADEMAALIKSGMHTSLQGKTLAEWVNSDPLLPPDTHRKTRNVISLNSSN